MVNQFSREAKVMEQENYSEWEQYNEEESEEVVAVTEVYELFMIQQQQLQDTSKFLQLVSETMQQTNSPPRDYQPLFVQLASKLQAISNQNQSIQKVLASQENQLKSLDRLDNGLKESRKTLSVLTKSCQELLGWQAKTSVFMVAIPLGLSLLVIGSYILMSQRNDALEQKIDLLNVRSEKILKKSK
jgi:hypothetical protein